MASTRRSRFEYVLFLESGPRDLAEQSLALLYSEGAERLDLLTCYDTPPQAFDPSRGTLFSVHAPEAAGNQFAFTRTLCARPYTAIAILSLGSAVLRNWKWVIALRSLTRLHIMDEHRHILRLTPSCAYALSKLLARRIAPSANRDWNLPEAILARLGVTLLIPFQVAFLLAYTAKVHAARRLRLAFRQVPHS